MAATVSENNDVLGGFLSTKANETSNVGIYDIEQGTLGSPNYRVSFIKGTLEVKQRSLVVTADSFSRLYGDANQALTYSTPNGGLVNGDTLTGSLETVATQTSNVGTYEITGDKLVASSNYRLEFKKGT